MVQRDRIGFVFVLQLGDAAQVLDSIWTFISLTVRLVITNLVGFP